jgi:hypothetical protein
MISMHNYEHYSKRLKPKDYQNFSVESTGSVELSTKKNKKPDFLTFESNMDIQLVKTFCPQCWQSKKLDKEFLNPNCWFRVLQDRDQNRAWVVAEVPDIGAIRSVYEIWKRYTIPYSNQVYGIEFVGHASFEKDPANFYEFYQKNKGEDFEKRLENAILEKCPYLFFNAMISINGKNCKLRFMFDKWLGSGQQGIVVRAINIDHPSQPRIAVKMFYSRIDDSVMPPIDLIQNEIKGRKLIPKDRVAQLLCDDIQEISNMNALTMEYIDGTTLEEFFEKNPKISEKQRTEFLQCSLDLLPTKDLNLSNIMVKWDATKELMVLVQIDLSWCFMGSNGFLRDLRNMLATVRKVSNKNWN